MKALTVLVVRTERELGTASWRKLLIWVLKRGEAWRQAMRERSSPGKEHGHRALLSTRSCSGLCGGHRHQCPTLQQLNWVWELCQQITNEDRVHGRDTSRSESEEEGEPICCSAGWGRGDTWGLLHRGSILVRLRKMGKGFQNGEAEDWRSGGHVGNKWSLINRMEAPGGWWSEPGDTVPGPGGPGTPCEVFWKALMTRGHFSSGGVAREIRVYSRSVIFILAFSYRTFPSNNFIKP